MPIVAKGKRLRAIVVSIASPVIFGGNAFAQQEGEQLVEQARCYACHETAEVSLGPPYVAIAARHAPRKDVMVDVLARKIVSGGGGNWGQVPMVPNQWVTIEEARLMSEWILSLAEE